MKRSNVKETQIDAPLVSNEWDRSRSNKVRFSYNLTQLYDYYAYIENAADKKVHTRKIFTTFIKTYLALVMKKIITQGYIFIMPHHLGRLYLHKTNRNGFLKKGGKVKPTLNLHSFRKFLAIKWDKETAHFKNRNIWRNDTSLEVKQWVAEEIKNNNKPIIDRPLIGHNHNEKKW